MALDRGTRSVKNQNSVRKDPRITILHVANCPLVDRLRSDVEAVLQAVESTAYVEQVEGRWASPTLMVDGVALEGFPPGSEAACRINLPTHEQIASALFAASPDGRTWCAETEDAG